MIYRITREAPSLWRLEREHKHWFRRSTWHTISLHLFEQNAWDEMVRDAKLTTYYNEHGKRHFKAIGW